MFVQSYVIITTGQIKTVWHDQYSTCWRQLQENNVATCPNNIPCFGLFTNTPQDMTPNYEYCTTDGTYPLEARCAVTTISSVSWIVRGGIMLGMLSFGYIAEWGRKAAGVLVCACMLSGLVVMTFVNSNTVNTMFAVWAVFFGLFGIGVGGEYPLSASCAAEKQDPGSSARTRTYTQENDKNWTNEEHHQQQQAHDMQQSLARVLRRGETISIAFAMQGVGALFGSLVLICLIYFSRQGHVDCNAPGSNESGYNDMALESIWRTFYFIGLLQVLILIVYRSLFEKESATFRKVLERKKKRQEQWGKYSTAKILRFYAPALIGTAGTWFFWDLGFYGLKLYSGPIFSAIVPKGDLMTLNLYILFNNACALVGYYCTTAVIDKKAVGRRMLQMVSFLVSSIIFIIMGFFFHSFPPRVTLALFIVNSFLGQFGPNVTIYVMAAERYPTELRSTCNGLSAFVGKCGALVGTVLFGYITTDQMFYVTGLSFFMGFVFTWLFSSDLTHVPLAEHDAQLEVFLEGTPEKYKGKLNKKEHLSRFEVWMGLHGEYDPNWARTFVKMDQMNRVHEQHQHKEIEC